jgi:hypothetical protein
MDPDTKFDSPILRHGRISLGHTALDFHRAAYCIDGAGKLYQHAVAGRFDRAASMGSYSGVNKSFSSRLEPGQGAFLVGTHEAAISGDIRSQHRRQSPVHALSGQKIPSRLVFWSRASKHIWPLLD